MATWINHIHYTQKIYSICIEFSDKAYFFRLKDSDIVDWQHFMIMKNKFSIENVDIGWDCTEDFAEKNGYIEIFLEDLE